MVDNSVVRDLVKKLKSFREAVMAINKGGLIRSNLIPPAIREEAAKMYTEHGGLDILIDVLHISADQIREWTRKLKANPDYYSQKANKGIVNGVIMESKMPKMPKKRKNPSFRCKSHYTSTLSGPTLRKCEEIKERVSECKSINNGSYTLELKKKVAKIIHECGDHKAVAKAIGMNEKTLAGWKYYFAEKQATGGKKDVRNPKDDLEYVFAKDDPDIQELSD